MRLICLSAFLVVLAACDRGAVTQPTPVPETPAVPGDSPQTSYSLGGWVFDTAFRPIEGATVEILSGPRAGAVTSTSADGTYMFEDGFEAAPEMQASKSGYRLVDARFYPAAGSTIRKWFRLGSLNPPVDLGGAYDLTFTADPACDALPSEARSRRYFTSVPGGNETSHTLVLSGASFATIDGQLIANTIGLASFENFVHLEFSDPPIWENLASPASLTIYGSAEGEVTVPTSHFKVSAHFTFCGRTDGVKCEEAIACHSNNHTLTLVRQ